MINIIPRQIQHAYLSNDYSTFEGQIKFFSVLSFLESVLLVKATGKKTARLKILILNC